MEKSNDTNLTNNIIKNKKDSKNKNDKGSKPLELHTSSLLRDIKSNFNDFNKYIIQDMNHTRQG